MDGTDAPWANELMAAEDQVQEEMREAFRKRLASRLQERVEAKERSLAEVSVLKKKGRSACNYKARSAPSPSAPRKDIAPRASAG